MLHYDTIPAELWLKILSFFDDFSTLYNFALASTRQRALVSQHSASLHFHICRTLGYTAENSFASSKPIYTSQSSVQDHANGDLEVLLRVAKRNQKTMIKSAFEDVNDWVKFASVKHSILRNWHSGAGKLSVSVTAKMDMPVWRWKFDPEFNYWAVTSLEGGIRVGGKTGVAGEHRKWSSWDSEPYSHLESSGPFLITTNSQGEFLIWRRSDAAFSPTLSTSDQASGPMQHMMRLDHIFPSFEPGPSNCALFFEREHIIHTPDRVHCFKARAPYLVAGSVITQAVYVWDLETGKLVEQYDISGPVFSPMRYIELDRHYIFLCGDESIAVYDRQSRHCVYEFSLGGAMLGRYRLPPTWVAVHHDMEGGHLLALSRDAKLLWTCTYDRDVKTKASEYVVLDISEGGAIGHNLCVENGRAVISIETAGGLGHAPVERVFLLNLHAWTSVEEFVAAAPRLVVLFNMVPSFEYTTRIEMDSCGVYLNSTGVTFEGESALVAQWACINEGYPSGRAALPSGTRWLDQAGGLICSQPVLSSTKQRSSKDEWEMAVDEWNQGHQVWSENEDEWATAILQVSFVDKVDKDKDNGDEQAGCTLDVGRHVLWRSNEWITL